MLRVLSLAPFAVVVALISAAVDTVFVRLRLSHRGLSQALYLESCVLWLAFSLLACLPAAWWLHRRERAGKGLPPAGRLALLAFLTAAPVLTHGRLDAYSDLGGGLAGLRQFQPWLQVAGVLLCLGVVCLGLSRLAQRWGTGPLTLGLSILSVGVGLLWAPAHQDPAPASLDPALRDKPNLLLLVWDTTRAQSLSIYGYDRRTTPHLEQLAAESIVFDEARSPSRYTLTSHLSMLTGVYPSDHGARMTRQRISPRKTPSVAGTLRDAGYRTAAFVGTGVLTAPTGVAFGFEHFDDLVDPPVCDTRAWALVHDLQSIVARLGPPFSQNGHPHWFQDFFRPAEEVLARASRWIDNGDPRPWFCMINLYDVHWPYLPEDEERRRWVEPYDGPVDGFHERSDRYPSKYRMESRDDAHLRELYDAEMAALDRDVDRFLAGLDLARANTAVLLSADHGEAFGEGGRYEHNDILEPQVHIPFLVRLPRAQRDSGRRVSTPISGIDVAPTLLGIAGLTPPAHYLGVDVLKLAAEAPGAAPGHPDERRPILVEDRDQLNAQDVTLALYDGPWKLVRKGLGKKMRFLLYDLSQDPVGLVDVAERHPEVVERLKAELDELRARWGANDLDDQQGTGFTNIDALKQLGYTGDSARN